MEASNQGYTGGPGTVLPPPLAQSSHCVSNWQNSEEGRSRAEGPRPTYGHSQAHATTAVSPGYRISWEEYNRTNTRVTHYLPNVTLEYRVTGLTALTTYTIEVAAMTAKGQGQVSASTISSGVPPGRCTWKGGPFSFRNVGFLPTELSLPSGPWPLGASPEQAT